MTKTEKSLSHNNQITVYESEDGEARIGEKSVTEEYSVTAADGKHYKIRRIC